MHDDERPEISPEDLARLQATFGGGSDVEVRELLANLARDRDDLQQRLDAASSHWGYEDPIYRFWHQSFKVYPLVQDATSQLVAALERLAPQGCRLDLWFCQIVDEGTGKNFELADNEQWLAATRPMLEAFFHARFMVEMAVRYAAEFEEPPQMLPSGFAALLTLYGIR